MYVTSSKSNYQDDFPFYWHHHGRGYIQTHPRSAIYVFSQSLQRYCQLLIASNAGDAVKKARHIMKSDNINQCIQTSSLPCLLLHPFSHLPHFYKTNNSNNLIFPINSKQKKKQHLHPQGRYLQFFLPTSSPPPSNFF